MAKPILAPTGMYLLHSYTIVSPSDFSNKSAIAGLTLTSLWTRACRTDNLKSQHRPSTYTAALPVRLPAALSTAILATLPATSPAADVGVGAEEQDRVSELQLQLQTLTVKHEEEKLNRGRD